MKVSYFSVHVSYTGSLSGMIQFSDPEDIVTHTLTKEQVDQLAALVESWKAQLLDGAASKLIQARDDLLALEHHGPTKAGLEDEIPF